MEEAQSGTGQEIMGPDMLQDTTLSDSTVKMAGPSHPVPGQEVNLQVHWFYDPETGESWAYKFVYR